MEQTIGNVKTVVINKNKLLDIIKENKAKHDAIFEVATSGYWQSAQRKLEEKRENFDKYLLDLSDDFDTQLDKLNNKISLKQRVDGYSYIPIQASMNYTIDLKYPENHAHEYERAIRSVELSVFDKIELSEQEFNQYVMNDWSWRNSFLTSSSGYITSITGCYWGSGLQNSVLISGCNIF
jgi:hypothetical protein